jgi:hypothetical protein
VPIKFVFVEIAFPFMPQNGNTDGAEYAGTPPAPVAIKLPADAAGCNWLNCILVTCALKIHGNANKNKIIFFMNFNF